MLFTVIYIAKVLISFQTAKYFCIFFMISHIFCVKTLFLLRRDIHFSLS